MKMKISIDMDTAAFTDYPFFEAKRILTALFVRLENDYSCEYNLRDINGNVVGSAKITGRKNYE